ncbi:leucyl/phenylalanyl-tRNA--protein transferase [Neisseria wadsworthii]|uniref:Leucyl/phenylalanyl-tRNA--protein transferase n=1 Tax=Neisseria wadsworthii 9715 TaxID=1030841 RepID=G4CLU2_9NEIS|nr:leucyl/phenylalanyl-tRNA--protein transferase [Neisseria wadsworthii]EGZ51300.1 leucyltransferase [Neisseria wadsworthii 9715]QMT36132.1 leucyl/phenylalanyl-tRNA--protein transferase [Neisseria wadsworthii]
MEIPFLPPGDHRFPDPRPALAENEGLVCVSTDLAVPRLLAAYPLGIFPWFEENGVFFWFAIAPRAVLFPKKIHIGRSLSKTLRNKSYAVTVNRNFPEVIATCSRIERPGQESSWIGPAFRQAYTELHKAGHAHSFECWYPDDEGILNLAGGFYGVQIGRAFFGESMFAAQPDASKIAFACAVPYLAECGIELIDCQQDTHHLARFGSEQMEFNDFQAATLRLSLSDLQQPINQGVLREQNIR